MARSNALLALLVVCAASLAAAKTDEVTVDFFKDEQCTQRVAPHPIPPLTLTFNDNECYTPEDLPATHSGDVTLPFKRGLVSFPKGSGSVKLACSKDGEFVEAFYTDDKCTTLLDAGKMPTACEDASKGSVHAYLRIQCAVKHHGEAADGMESNAVKAARAFFSRFF
eukprot:tig00001428_g8726.t1